MKLTKVIIIPSLIILYFFIAYNFVFTIDKKHFIIREIKLPEVEETKELKPKLPKEFKNLSSHISKKYKISSKESEDIVRASILLAGEDNSFPTYIDILSIIAIESSFNRKAVSSAEARGLMQILYKKVPFDIENNIIAGVFLLKDYNKRLKNKDFAIQAYNLGIGSFKSGNRNIEYLTKFKKAKKGFNKINANNSNSNS